MKKLEIKIFENFRTFEKEGVNFKTNLQCRNCLQLSGNYILLEGWIRICKGCLSDWINKLDENRMEHVGNARRTEK